MEDIQKILREEEIAALLTRVKDFGIKQSRERDRPEDSADPFIILVPKLSRNTELYILFESCFRKETGEVERLMSCLKDKEILYVQGGRVGQWGGFDRPPTPITNYYARLYTLPEMVPISPKLTLSNGKKSLFYQEDLRKDGISPYFHKPWINIRDK